MKHCVPTLLHQLLSKERSVIQGCMVIEDLFEVEAQAELWL
jgi:hypothetical protein